jgi:hypothetical protein
LAARVNIALHVILAPSPSPGGTPLDAGS